MNRDQHDHWSTRINLKTLINQDVKLMAHLRRWPWEKPNYFSRAHRQRRAVSFRLRLTEWMNGPLASQSRSPGRESTQRLRTCYFTLAIFIFNFEKCPPDYSLANICPLPRTWVKTTWLMLTTTPLTGSQRSGRWLVSWENRFDVVDSFLIILLIKFLFLFLCVFFSFQICSCIITCKFGMGPLFHYLF